MNNRGEPLVIKSMINFRNLSAIIIDPDEHSRAMVSEMLRSAGSELQVLVANASEAMDFLLRGGIDLCILESALPDMSGFDIVRAIRRLKDPHVRSLPVIVMVGRINSESVAHARDSGADSIIKKPISPRSLFDRIAWCLKNDRAFVESDTYVGPDRRFKSVGPPNGIGRRKTDLPSEISADTEPNMSQDECDALTIPTKIATS